MSPLRSLSPIAFVSCFAVSGIAFAQETTQQPAPTAAPTSAPQVQTTASTEAQVNPLAPVPAAEPTPESDSYPRLGGHIGTAIPIVTLSKDPTVIGADFVKIGVTPGITVHLDDKWMIDFEFIAFNELKATPAATTFIVDPGVLRKFGPVTAGVRVATEVGAASNIGIVPIIVIPVVKVSKRLSYFVEADVPLFLRDTGIGTADRSLQPSATFLFQTGLGF